MSIPKVKGKRTPLVVLMERILAYRLPDGKTVRQLAEERWYGAKPK